MQPDACVTVKACPAMVSVPTRCGPALAVTVRVTEPFPVPPAGATLRPPPVKFVVTAAVHPQLELLALMIITGYEPAVLGTL